MCNKKLHSYHVIIIKNLENPPLLPGREKLRKQFYNLRHSVIVIETDTDLALMMIKSTSREEHIYTFRQLYVQS